MLHSETPSFQPVAEQRLAVELLLAGGNLRIDAYAGEGRPADAQRGISKYVIPSRRRYEYSCPLSD